MRQRPSTAADPRHVAIVCLLVVLALITGCSTERRLDRQGLESQIGAQLFPEHPELVTAVNCPDLQDPAPGRSFVCAAQLGDQIIDVPVELGGTIDELEAVVELDERFVAAREIADLLAETFTREIAIPTTVDCGQAIMVIEPAAPVLCAAADPSGAIRTFEVAIDVDGALVVTIR